MISDTTVTISDLREDIIQPSQPLEEVLKTAEEHDGTYFIVPLLVD